MCSNFVWHKTEITSSTIMYTPLSNGEVIPCTRMSRLTEGDSMSKSIYENNYDKMVNLGIITEEGQPTFKEYKKMQSENFMDLNLDVLSISNTETIVSMAHNFVQEGDVMADPDMEIRIIPDKHMIEALSFRQDNGGIYYRVYSDDGTLVNPALKDDLNSFLGQWLQNLIDQGFPNNGSQVSVST